jgi:hypothetical protein
LQLAQHARVYGRWIHVQLASQVKPESQAVEKRPAAQHVRESECADKVGQRVWWIGQDKNHSVRCSRGELGENLPVHAGVGLE